MNLVISSEKMNIGPPLSKL